MNYIPLVFTFLLYLMIGGALVAASLKRLNFGENDHTWTVLLAALIATVVWLPAVIYKKWRDDHEL